MGRILAIDYGRRRVGLAVTDILQIVPNGLTTVRACDALDYITRYVAAEDVEQIIIGLPRQMSGEYSESMTYDHTNSFRRRTLHIHPRTTRHDRGRTKEQNQKRQRDGG